MKGGTKRLPITDEERQRIDGLFEMFWASCCSGTTPSVLVAKRLAVLATRKRNIGAVEALRRHPFAGVCEASGLPLSEEDKTLDEVTAEGYYGTVRWTCPRGNNSGLRSCGGCV